MNTYVVPLNCERRQASSAAHQMTIFLCRTSQDHQYRRISFMGMSIQGTTGWDVSKAKISTIFVPNDAHMLDLAPHAGLPVVYIESNLQAWKLPKRDVQMPSWVMYAGTAAREPEPVQGETEPTTSTSERLPMPPAGEDPESGTRGLDDEEGTGPVTLARGPWKVSQVQLRFRNLKEGSLIAFSRLANPGAEFYYYVEIGFDMDFRPVCILHARRLHWKYNRLCNWLLLLPVLIRVIFHRYGPSMLPVCKSFWTNKKSRLEKSDTSLFSGPSENCAICSAEEARRDFYMGAR